MLAPGVALGEAPAVLRPLELQAGQLTPELLDAGLGGGQAGRGLVDGHVHGEGVALAGRDGAHAHDEGGDERGGSSGPEQ